MLHTSLAQDMLSQLLLLLWVVWPDESDYYKSISSTVQLQVNLKA